MCQFTQTSFDKVHGYERIVNVVKYLNQNEDTDSLSSSASLLSDKIEYSDFNEEFQRSQCLTVNNCISDNASSTVSVVNKYLNNEIDPRTKE